MYKCFSRVGGWDGLASKFFEMEIPQVAPMPKPNPPKPRTFSCSPLPGRQAGWWRLAVFHGKVTFRSFPWNLTTICSLICRCPSSLKIKTTTKNAFWCPISSVPETWQKLQRLCFLNLLKLFFSRNFWSRFTALWSLNLSALRFF